MAFRKTHDNRNLVILSHKFKTLPNVFSFQESKHRVVPVTIMHQVPRQPFRNLRSLKKLASDEFLCRQGKIHEIANKISRDILNFYFDANRQINSSPSLKVTLDGFPTLKRHLDDQTVSQTPCSIKQLYFKSGCYSGHRGKYCVITGSNYRP